ncbi:hypothetical protein [Bradyrhizobium niftali]|jgi:hypothetical protein|uniref:hypothetical protein n=1 Tax=Bradyrhizobium niftali TaxID=2560055 RepID=UPI0014302901|nr:hypothetical protein [Bradyrhizobium niftali]
MFALEWPPAHFIWLSSSLVGLFASLEGVFLARLEQLKFQLRYLQLGFGDLTSIRSPT